MDTMTDRQRARADALQHARNVLVSAGVPIGVLDILQLAHWIITGRDPYNDGS